MRTRDSVAAVCSSSTAPRTRAQVVVAALLCCPMDASEGLRRHRPLHLCCPTDVSAGRCGRLPLSSDPQMRSRAAAVAMLRPSPPSQRTLIRFTLLRSRLRNLLSPNYDTHQLRKVMFLSSMVSVYEPNGCPVASAVCNTSIESYNYQALEKALF